jgi:putative hydrolase of the HAD superfamily
MVLVFDMDDTLYEEATYVRSGFMAVANHLAPLLGCPPERLHMEMMSILNDLGRGKVFDALLQRHGKLSRRNVNACVTLYRRHQPDIRIHRAGRDCLHRFGHLPLYVVTDGNKTAQASKVRALGLESLVRRVFITHRSGLRHSKPSPHCFQIIQRLEASPASRIWYVGDNPAKDFVGIRPLGFRTLRVLTGPHAAIEAKPEYDAEFRISSLDELTPQLLMNSV